MGLATNSYRKTVRLTDGGVFDNLGLATAWAEYKDILVSDGGQAMQPRSATSTNWLRQVLRILDVVDNQVRT